MGKKSLISLVFLLVALGGVYSFFHWVHEYEQLETSPQQAREHYGLPEELLRGAESITRDMDTDRLRVLWRQQPQGLHESLRREGWQYREALGYYTLAHEGVELRLLVEDAALYVWLGR